MLPLFILLLMLFLRVKDPDSLIPLHFSKTYVVLVATLPNHNVGTQRSSTRSSHHSHHSDYSSSNYYISLENFYFDALYIFIKHKMR